MRFPLVDLPDRPALDALLRDAELALVWNTNDGRFQRAATAVGELSVFTSFISRDATRHAVTPASPSRPPRTTDPAATEVAEREARLQRARHHGGFLALRVPLRHRRETRTRPARFTTGLDVLENFDIEARFLAALRCAAKPRRGASVGTNCLKPTPPQPTPSISPTCAPSPRGPRHRWRPTCSAWAPDCGVESGAGWHGHMGVIYRWRDVAGRSDATVQTLWLVVFGYRTATRPTLDGEAVPVLGPSEWADLTPGWLAGGHRRAGSWHGVRC